jgi:hypothetical protein
MSGDVPDESVTTQLARHFERHLTTTAMAEYVLRRSGLAEARTVLFVDEQLPVRIDYMSALTAIGLRRTLGTTCHLAWDVPYLHADYRGPTESLYGRGFGIAGALEVIGGRKGRKSRRERGRPGGYDAIVVGSIARNGPLAARLLRTFPKDRTVWIHGEDQPPSPREFHYMREAGVHLFVRSVPCLPGE